MLYNFFMTHFNAETLYWIRAITICFGFMTVVESLLIWTQYFMSRKKRKKTY